MSDKHPMDSVPMPEVFGYLCEWRAPVGLPNTQHLYYGEPANGVDDDWNRHPDIHKNLPLHTSDQIRAYGLSAYEMGRNVGLEEAAAHFCAKRHGCEMFAGAIEDELRSLKR